MNIDQVVGAAVVLDNKNRKRWVATRTDFEPGESPDEHKVYYLYKDTFLLNIEYKWKEWNDVDTPHAYLTKGGALRDGRRLQRLLERRVNKSRREYEKRIRLV